MNTITIEIDKAEGTALLKCLGRAIQQAETEMDRWGHSKRGDSVRAEWTALDNVLAQIQNAKADAWYGGGVS